MNMHVVQAKEIGIAIGDETRAMNNMHGCRARSGAPCGWGNGNWYIGLNVWVPNLNMYVLRGDAVPGQYPARTKH